MSSKDKVSPIALRDHLGPSWYGQKHVMQMSVHHASVQIDSRIQNYISCINLFWMCAAFLEHVRNDYSHPSIALKLITFPNARAGHSWKEISHTLDLIVITQLSSHNNNSILSFITLISREGFGWNALSSLLSFIFQHCMLYMIVSLIVSIV